MTEEKPGLIYKKIPAIMAEVGIIGKDRKNTSQGYSFRGVDDVYNEIHDMFVKHKVFTIPTVLDTQHEERKSKSGGILIYRIYTVKYTFYAEDGSFIESIIVGEGMDSGDKAGNKALSVAHKYALLQTFLIPTDDPKDPENESHQLNGKPSKVNPKKNPDLGETEDGQDISDFSSNPDEDAEEKKAIAKWIKEYLEKSTIDYKSFKTYLHVTDFKPKRQFTGKQFGNVSISEGSIEDLRYLKKNIDKCISLYIQSMKSDE